MGAGLAAIRDLQERIRQLEAAPRPVRSLVGTGVHPFDAFLGGGFPLGCAVELCGPPGSGRTSLALRTVATAISHAGLSAYVDAAGQLYGPAAQAMGVALESLLVIRPESASQAVWSAVQLARSGTMSCVVLDLTGTGHRLTPSESKRLADAASKSGGLLLMITSPEQPGEGAFRLRVDPQGLEGFRVEVMRARRMGLKETVISWDALYVRAPAWRHRSPHAIQQVSIPRLHIYREPPEDPALSRNGPVGVHGSRPGRDLSMPPLESVQGMGG